MTTTEKAAIQAMFADVSGKPLKMAENKPRLSLVPYEVKSALASVYAYGAQKYHRDSWRSITAEQAKAFMADAAERHLSLHNSGEIIDPESGLPHLAQAAWNCLTLLVLTGE